MFSSPETERRNRLINMILSVVAVVLIACFGFVMLFDNSTEQKKLAQDVESAKQEEDIQRQQILGERNEEVELEKRKETDSFYQKLEDGFDVRILVIGDNIGSGEGATDPSKTWTEQLSKYLRETYNVEVYLKNVSMSGNSSYAGYVRTMVLSDRAQYDLAIICYGQNDQNTKFQMYYESIIRAIRSKYDKCSIISVLESSQKKYTSKMEIIKSLAEHYNFPVADTIAPFTDGSNGAYETLTDKDGINPNDKGHQIYAEVISDIIDQEVDLGTEYDYSEVEHVNPGVDDFDMLTAVNARDFTKNGNNYIYNVTTPISGIMGIDYKYITGKNNCKIYIDGKEYNAPEADPKNDSMQLRIIVFNDKSINVKSSIEVRFTTTEQSEGFRGVCFSSENENIEE